jgi:hypothetical protein
MADLPFGAAGSFGNLLKTGTFTMDSQGIKYAHDATTPYTWSDLDESHLPRARYFQMLFQSLHRSPSSLLQPSECLLPPYPLIPSPLVVSILPQFPFKFSYNFGPISCRSVAHPPYY